MKEREIGALEATLGYHFRRRAVIEQALTHSSQAREQESQQAGESKYKVNDNEQLEFLGDAILVAGDQRRIVSALSAVSRGRTFQAAGACGERTAFDSCGAAAWSWATICAWDEARKKAAGAARPLLLVDALEAVIAAIYLDGGMEPAREFILREILTPGTGADGARGRHVAHD